MAFAEEKDFEKALIELLSTKGWEKDVLRFPTEEDLIQNWANILFENNREKDRLNDYRLTRKTIDIVNVSNEDNDVLLDTMSMFGI